MDGRQGIGAAYLPERLQKAEIDKRETVRGFAATMASGFLGESVQTIRTQLLHQFEISPSYNDCKLKDHKPADGKARSPCKEKGYPMLYLAAAIPLLIALASSGMLVESLNADDLSRMGIAV